MLGSGGHHLQRQGHKVYLDTRCELTLLPRDVAVQLPTRRIKPFFRNTLGAVERFGKIHSATGQTIQRFAKRNAADGIHCVAKELILQVNRVGGIKFGEIAAQ